MTEIETGQPEEEATLAAVEAAPDGRRRRSFLFEATRLMAANGVHAAVMVCVGIATIRIWGVEVRGDIQMAMAVPGMLSVLFDLGLSRALPYMIGRKVGSLERVTGAAMSLWLAASVVAIVIVIAYYASPAMTSLPILWLVLAAAMIPLRLFASLANGFAVGVERVGFLAKVVWFRAPIQLAVVLTGGVLLGLSAPEYGWIRVAATVLAFAVGGVLGLFLIARWTRIHLSWDWRLVGETTKRSFVFGIGPLFTELTMLMPGMLITLTFFASSVTRGEIGVFTVGSSIAMLLFQVAQAVGHVLMSRSVNATDHRAQAVKTARLVRVGLAGAVPAATCMWIVAPVLVPLVYGRDVAHAATVMRYMLPGVVAFFVLHTLAVDLTGKGRAWLVAAVTGPMMLTTVGVDCLYAIPRFGIDGAAIAASAIYIVSACALLVVYGRATGLTFYEMCRPHRDDLQVWHAVRRKLPRWLGGG